MKQFFTTATLMLALATATFAQTPVVNGDLENWTTLSSSNGNYEDLPGPFLKTLNKLYELPAVVGGPGPLTTTKTTDICGAGVGTYAAQITSKIFQGIFIPGALGTFDITIAPPAAKIGKPYTDRPTKVKYCAKYSSVQGDSAEVFCKLTKWVNNQHVVLGQGSLKHYQSVGTYTNYEFDINYSSNETPDSVQLLAVASAGYDFAVLTNSTGQENSTLFIDNLAFEFGTGIEENLMKETKLYPVPFSSELTVQLPEGAKANSYKILDITGRTVAAGEITNSSTTISAPFLNTGSYWLELSNGNGVIFRRQVQKF